LFESSEAFTAKPGPFGGTRVVRLTRTGSLTGCWLAKNSLDWHDWHDWHDWAEWACGLNPSCPRCQGSPGRDGSHAVDVIRQGSRGGSGVGVGSPIP
jgi:hypothetical protein